MRIAVIDLGTNTFHLLICEIRANQTEIIYKSKQYVKLAEGGIGSINIEAYQRAIEALQHFKQAIVSYEAQKITAFGTAALRTASNGIAFVQQVKNETGIEIEIISGDKEAELIWKGVRQAINMDKVRHLIMDIGGGSVEFIIANDQQIFWKKSFPIGAAILKRLYHKNDPISLESQILLNQFIDKSIDPLREALAQFPCEILIGASGTFDSIVDINLAQKGEQRNDETTTAYAIEYSAFQTLYKYLITSTNEQRLAIPGMSPQRVEMIVVACQLINNITAEFELYDIVQSEYAMKQGILWTVAQELELKDEN